jgi:signal transduction histidine kinase
VEVLMGEVKRLETILDDFLRFTGGHKLTKAPTHLNEVVEEVVEFLRPRFREADIEVRPFLGDLPWLHLDRDAVKQVLMNLMLNAIEATPAGGEVMVRTARDGTSVVLDLTDTGEGIPPDLLEKVWQVYYSRRRTGTGMGLPTAQRIVEEHDGTISLVSEVGKGTRFTLRFPVPMEIPG